MPASLAPGFVPHLAARENPMTTPDRRARLFILLTVLIDATGMGIIFPVMPDLLEELTHGTLAQAAIWGGILSTSYAAMQFLFGPIIGNLSDSWGRRPVMLLALLVMAADFVAMALAHTVWLLLATRIIGGISAATHSTATAYMADISPPEQKGRNFGLIGAAFGIGFVLGPVLGGAAAHIDLRAPFWIAGGLAAANLVFGWFVLPETVTDRIRRPFTWSRANPLASFAAIGKMRRLRPYLIVFAIFQLAMFVYPAIWSFWAKARFGWEPAMIGLSLALFGVSMAVVNTMLVGPVIKRLGAPRAVFLSFVLEVMACVFYGLVTSGTAALFFTPFAALAAFGGPGLQQIMSNAVPADQQGELQGVLGSLTALSTALSPLLMTWAFSFFTSEKAPMQVPGAPYLLAAGLMVVAILMLPRPPRRKGLGGRRVAADSAR
ncbi:TCR/Tet family MFS transporter [Paracoccus zhouxuedongae]|uniref:TCR/Tet family MFS transporter n=1 Tax=Paracoccus sp. p4-l81 TaxID=3342806 RepID=UPI0035BC67D6